MTRFFQESPWWVLIIVWFVFFSAWSVISRLGVRRAPEHDRRAELAEYAGKTLNPIGAVFAFLIGFAATMTWSALNAGQEAVDSQAAAAQQLAWSTKSISDTTGVAEVVGNLTRYLNVEVNQDIPLLARGQVTDLPSAPAYDLLQHSVHNVAYKVGTSGSEAGAMTAAAAALTDTQSKITAVAQRSLPALLIGLLVAAGVLLALAMGAAAAEVRRPYLMYGWAAVSAIALTLILTLDGPFRGIIAVNMNPLIQVSDSLAATPIRK